MYPRPNGYLPSNGDLYGTSLYMTLHGSPFSRLSAFPKFNYPTQAVLACIFIHSFNPHSLPSFTRNSCGLYEFFLQALLPKSAVMAYYYARKTEVS